MSSLNNLARQRRRLVYLAPNTGMSFSPNTEGTPVACAPQRPGKGIRAARPSAIAVL